MHAVIDLICTCPFKFEILINNEFEKYHHSHTNIKMDRTGDRREDNGEKELNAFVQSLLKQMQDRFEEMSTGVVSRIDDMGKYYSLYT